MAYSLTFSVALGLGKTGLSATLRAQIVDVAGASVGGAQSGFVEIGASGNYMVTLSIADGQTGGVKFYDTGAPTVFLAFAAINPQDAENLDAKITTRTKPADTLARVTLVDTTTTNTDMRGTNNALLASSYTAPDNADIAIAATASTSAASSSATAATNTITIINRLGAFTGSGLNTVFGFFRSLLSKVATAPSDVGGTFDPATDSTEAIRDRGDIAWGASGSDPLMNPVEDYPDGTAGGALRRIGSAEIITTSPMTQRGDFEVVPGDDYNAADIRAISWVDKNNKWSDLTGATAILEAWSNYSQTVSITLPLTIPIPSGTGKKLQLEMTGLQSALFTQPNYRFKVTVTLSSGRKFSPILGRVEVTT